MLLICSVTFRLIEANAPIALLYCSVLTILSTVSKYFCNRLRVVHTPNFKAHARVQTHLVA